MNIFTIKTNKLRIAFYSVCCLASAWLIVSFLNQFFERNNGVAEREISFKMIAELILFSTIIFLSIVISNYFRKENKLLRFKLKEITEGNKSKVTESFISATSHEMEASYYAIFSIISLLSREEKKQNCPSIKMLIGDLKAACKISKNTIDNILEYGKNQTGIISPIMNKPVDIRFLLANIVEVYEALADEKKVKIRTEVSNELPEEVIADERKLRHIIVNLLHNSIKFTPNNSEVLISVTYNGENLTIEVLDQGDGIMHEDIKKLFQPFATKNPDGLGLGLYVVKELAASLNATVKVNDTQSKGSRFSVSIPVNAVSPKATQKLFN